MLQTKLVLALREYRLLHAAASRGTTLPHNKLIFPPTLRYLPVWILGACTLLFSCAPNALTMSKN